MSFIERFYFESMPARRLAAVRVYVGLYATVYLLLRLPHLLRFATYDASIFAPVGLASLLDAPIAPGVYRGAVALTVALSFAFVLGFAHRLLAPLFAVLLVSVLTYTSSFGKILHTDNLLVLHVAVLAVAPCADALSIRARGVAEPAPHGRYGWPIKLLCLVTVAAYFLAGIAKLRHSGLAFFDGENLRNYIAFDNVRKAELGSISSPVGPWLLGFTPIFTGLAALSLALELGAPLALVRRSIGRAWSVAVAGFHLGVLVLMAIGFAYPLTGAAFAAFFDLERVRARRARSASRAEEPVQIPREAAEREARDA
ncbi:MAG: hypothetical protein H5U40_05165 [Polyangiaceae bacterium]|nr:hypothetical protein [Polyangiaceae bacterium]